MNPGDEKLPELDLRDDAIEDDRERRREQQPERARGRQKSGRELRRVFPIEKHREQEPAHREDGHAASAGEARKKRAHHDRDHGDAARKPTHECREEIYESTRRSPFRKDEAREREQRDRRKHGFDREVVSLGRDRGDREEVVPQQDRGDATDADEDRRAERDGSDERPDERDHERQEQARFLKLFEAPENEWHDGETRRE